MGKRAYSRAGIMQRLFNAPLQVLPETASIVLGAIGDRFDVGQLFVAADGRTMTIKELEASARAWTDQKGPMLAASEIMFVDRGVAHVEIRGELVSENGIGPSSGFTGYDGIRAQVGAADRDPGVLGIVADIYSPGGEVASLYELVAFLMARRGTKPMRAVIRDTGASAAYAIAACADEVTLHPLGIAGSIGTIAMHADFSKKLEQDGIKVTLIMAGEHKADGNPFEPLPEEVRNRIAAMIATANDQFIRHVAAARAMSEEAVRGQQAQIYQGEEAIAAGLVDKIMSWSDSIEEFVSQVNGGKQGDRSARSAPGARSSQEMTMSDNIPAPAAETPEYTQASQDAAVAAATTAATNAERSRITALLELDADSTVSPALAAAIDGAQSAGDFAIALAKAGKEQQAQALTDAAGDAVQTDQLPEKRSEGSLTTTSPNRGQAVVDSLRGKHRSIPARG